MSLESIKAYINIVDEVKPLERKIIELLASGGFALRQVSQKLYMPLQTASARLSELHDKGIIEQRGKKYYLTSVDRIQEVKKNRENLRFDKWVKLGEKENFFSKLEAQKLDEYFDRSGKPRHKEEDIPQSSLPF
jgi:hypothetical protein